jgi:hypothetical protein
LTKSLVFCTIVRGDDDVKSENKKLIGFILIALGIVILFNRLEIWNVNLFFNGWWTLLLIVPAVYLIIKNGINTGNLVILLLGVFFLLDEIGYNLKGYLLPALLVVLGIGVLFRRK